MNERITTGYCVEIHVGKSKKSLVDGLYKVHHTAKFPTRDGADEFLNQFNNSCDSNRRAVYVGENDERTN